jgi:hypothetical protein
MRAPQLPNLESAARVGFHVSAIHKTDLNTDLVAKATRRKLGTHLQVNKGRQQPYTFVACAIL